MKLTSIFSSLALPALVAATASVNIRGTSIRGLSSSSSEEPLSGGAWMFYLMLNAVMLPIDLAGYGCNCDYEGKYYSSSSSSSSSSSWNNRKLENASWGSTSTWSTPANTWTTAPTWGSTSWSSWSWGGGSHHSSPKHHPPKPPKRCNAPHPPPLVKPKPPPKPHPPKKPSSSHSSSWSWGGDSWGDDWGGDHSGGDQWGGETWQGNAWDGSTGYQTSQMAYTGDSGSSSGVIVGVVLSLTVVAVAAALVAKKKFGYFQNGFFPSQKCKKIRSNALSDTDDDSFDEGRAHSSSYLEMTDNGPIPPPPAAPAKKLSRWRSAIDAATGRTYYYMKGSKMTSWVKPSDM